MNPIECFSEGGFLRTVIIGFFIDFFISPKKLIDIDPLSLNAEGRDNTVHQPWKPATPTRWAAGCFEIDLSDGRTENQFVYTWCPPPFNEGTDKFLLRNPPRSLPARSFFPRHYLCPPTAKPVKGDQGLVLFLGVAQIKRLRDSVPRGRGEPGKKGARRSRQCRQGIDCLLDDSIRVFLKCSLDRARKVLDGVTDFASTQPACVSQIGLDSTTQTIPKARDFRVGHACIARQAGNHLGTEKLLGLIWLGKSCPLFSGSQLHPPLRCPQGRMARRPGAEPGFDPSI